MKAVVLTAPGDSENFCGVDVLLPEPDRKEVRIRVEAAGFNPADYKMRKTIPADTAPMILGGEVSGVIDALGEDVSEFQIGEAVYAYLPLKRGGYAEYVCTSAPFVARKPSNVSFAQAATLPLAGLTALACVRKGEVLPGTPLFIAGGSGGVGSLAIQLARVAGASPVVTTAGSDASAGYLKTTLGFSSAEIVRYDSVADHQLAAHVRASNKGGFFPVSLDFVGGSMTRLCCEVVDFDGCITSIVQRLDLDNEERLLTKSASYRFVNLRARAKFGDPSTWVQYRTALMALSALVERQQLQPPPVRDMGALSAETVRAAHRLMEAGHVQGKLVMTIR